MVKINPDLLTDKVKQILIEDAQSFYFQKNDILVELGQVCKHIYYIEKGMLRNFYYDRKGNDITHWFAKDGMILTVPPSFFKKAPSEFRMEALEDTHVKALTHHQLEKAFESSIQLERFMRILVTETMITLGKKIRSCFKTPIIDKSTHLS